jgi:hypothetical protein
MARAINSVQGNTSRTNQLLSWDNKKSAWRLRNKKFPGSDIKIKTQRCRYHDNHTKMGESCVKYIIKHPISYMTLIQWSAQQCLYTAYGNVCIRLQVPVATVCLPRSFTSLRCSGKVLQQKLNALLQDRRGRVRVQTGSCLLGVTSRYRAK